VHLMPTLMERQLDVAAGALLHRDLEARGISFFVNGQTEAIFGEGRAEMVLLADGRQIPADFVVLAIGIRPNVDLARQAKLDVNRGILVGDDMRTSEADIYAVGECIEHNGQVFGLVAPIWEQAKVCGARLAGDTTAVYEPPPIFTSLKITGVDVFSAGALAATDDCDEELTLHDAAGGLYKKVILRGDRVVGSVLYGSVGDGPWYVQLMRDKAAVSSFRDQIVFCRGFAEAASLAPQIESEPDAAAESIAEAGRQWKAA
jgi:nitrite reductase (NADH) large subunit